ncbi:MAG TPA: hypothetical protein VEX86_01375 [Longimicrobium sp.]|nr:hypothetical protein [Longimicrobium sp.]
MYILRKLLWVDCIAGALVGVAVLMLSGWLSNLYALPRSLLLFTAGANVLYASYSFSLAVRARRSMASINLLVFANLAWLPVCLGIVVLFRESATLFGIAHMMAEGMFVAGLALLEWRQRDRLLVAA